MECSTCVFPISLVPLPMSVLYTPPSHSLLWDILLPPGTISSSIRFIAHPILVSNFPHSSCLFFFSVLFIYFTLQYCSGFCHTLTWISHGCTCVPHPEPPSYVPPHPIPQRHPSAPALNTLSHALNLDRWSVSHMVIYMFQCCSLKSSHPCPLPESISLFFISVSLSLSCV